MLDVSKSWCYQLFVTNEPRKYSNQMLAVSKNWRYRLIVTNEPRPYSN